VTYSIKESLAVSRMSSVRDIYLSYHVVECFILFFPTGARTVVVEEKSDVWINLYHTLHTFDLDFSLGLCVGSS